MRNIREIADQFNNECHTINLGDKAETLPDQNAPIGFACPVCGEVYSTLQEATECRDQPYDDGGLKVGDIVVIPGCCHYQICLDDPWLAFAVPGDPESASHFDRTSYRVPFFVITAIHAEKDQKHRCAVTVASLLGDSLRIGWNPANGEDHYEIFKLTGERVASRHNDYWVNKWGTLLAQCVVPEQVKEEAAALVAIGLSTRSLL